MASGLSAYLAARMGRPFVWGRDDCVTFAADWVLQRTGRDPIAPWRGRYTGPDSARIAAGPGGLRVAFRDACLAAGLARVDPPQAGDVGLVRTPAPLGLACAIFDGALWVGVTERGLSYQRRAVAMWGLR